MFTSIDVKADWILLWKSLVVKLAYALRLVVVQIHPVLVYDTFCITQASCF